MTQGDQEEPDNASGGGKPAAPKHEIVAAIDALGKKYETSQKGRPEHDAEILKRTKRATFGVGIYTLITIVIAGLNYCALREAQNQTIQARRQANAATVPYIFATFRGADTVHGWISRGKSGKGWSIDVDVNIANYGQVPGVLVDLVCNSLG